MKDEKRGEVSPSLQPALRSYATLSPKGHPLKIPIGMKNGAGTAFTETRLKTCLTSFFAFGDRLPMIKPFQEIPESVCLRI